MVETIRVSQEAKLNSSKEIPAKSLERMGEENLKNQKETNIRVIPLALIALKKRTMSWYNVSNAQDSFTTPALNYRATKFSYL